MAAVNILAVKIAVLALIALASTARADIYSYTDETGASHFSNIPNDRRYTLFLKEQSKPHSQPSIPVQTARTPFSRENRAHFYPLIQTAASTHAIDPSLLHAVILAESGYNPRAVSRKGAMGLMQLMPGTASRYGVSDAFDPVQNVHAGARYLNDLLKMFNQDLNLALAAYNAGEKSVIKYGNRIPPYRETVAYVPKVLDNYRKFRTAGL